MVDDWDIGNEVIRAYSDELENDESEKECEEGEENESGKADVEFSRDQEEMEW